MYASEREATAISLAEATPRTVLGLLRTRWWPTWKSGGGRAAAPESFAATPQSETHVAMKRSMWCQRVELFRHQSFPGGNCQEDSCNEAGRAGGRLDHHLRYVGLSPQGDSQPCGFSLSLVREWAGGETCCQGRVVCLYGGATE